MRIPTTLVAVLLCVRVNVFAQAPGRVGGRVVDQTGAALPGVSIDLVAGSREQTAVTDDTGVYRFDAVPPSTAVLTFPAPEFQRAATFGKRGRRYGGERRRRPDTLAERGCRRHGCRDVSQRC